MGNHKGCRQPPNVQRQKKPIKQNTTLSKILWSLVVPVSLAFVFNSCTGDTPRNAPLTQKFNQNAAPTQNLTQSDVISTIDTWDYQTLLMIVNNHMMAQNHGDFEPILQKHVKDPDHQIWMLRMVIYEASGGNPNIVAGDQNFIRCMNSAVGSYQFIRSTAEGYDLVSGTKGNCGFDHRQDPDKSTAKAYAFMQTNIRALEKNGIEATGKQGFVNAYMLHQQGPTGGLLLLKTPSKSITSILNLEAVQANCPSGACEDMTAQEFKNSHAEHIDNKIANYALNLMEMNDRVYEALAKYVVYSAQDTAQSVDVILAKRSSYGKYGSNIVSIIEKDINIDIDELPYPPQGVLDSVKDHIRALIKEKINFSPMIKHKPFVLCQDQQCNKLGL